MTSLFLRRLPVAGALFTVALGAACAGGVDGALGPRGPSRRPALASGALPSVRISEIHYDNAATDVGEAVEVSFPVGTDLTGYRIVRYNGASPSAAVIYTTPAATTGESLAGITPTVCTGGARAVVVVRYPENGLQNGPNDGLALVSGSTVVELLSYEGPFTVAASATVGAGMTSTDIGVSQTGSATLDPIGASLQRDGSGVWTRTTANTFDACNDSETAPPATVASVTVAPATASVAVGGTTTLVATARDAGGQTIAGVTFSWETNAPGIATVSSAGVVTGVGVGGATITARAPNGAAGAAAVTVTAAAGQASNVRVSEFHYDNEGTDTGERIEIEGDAGGSLAGWSLVLYSGSTGSATQGQSYRTIPLAGTLAACAGSPRGVAVFDAPGLQNGDKDGFALVNAAGQVVELLSYEGAFAAVDGPAAGMTSIDVGVAETSGTPIGRSLQRAGNGAWFGPATATFGACSAAVPPAPQAGITFAGRLSSDPALPIGFQDQLFATLRDAGTGAAIPTTFTWSSDTPAIVSVDVRGVVAALAAGTGVVRATAADGTTATISLPTEVPVFGNPAVYGNHLAFGTPTDDTPGDELRVTRDQYVLSYSRERNTANWAAYRLTKSNRGDLPGYRCDCFTPDPLVTAPGENGISTADYTGSGFDRGHMVRSNDRELARGDQAVTYYMSNIVPQYANLNQGRWADLEAHLQAVAEGTGQPDVYIITGTRGNAGTIAGGLVVVPTHTWKVAVVLPAGTSPASVTRQSDILDVIAVDMPNVSNLARDGNWGAHRVSVDSVERATGYDLLSALANAIEEVIESGDRAPTARISGAGTAGGAEGQTLVFSAATSSDPDVGGPLADVLSYQWSVGGAVAGIGPTLAHTFADDGTYAVRLIVADRFGLADTATAMVTVTNVAPTVAAFAGASILRGETYAATGGFTDPGADAWTATVDYGDGTPTAPLALSGKAFQLSHVYAAAGTYTVRVTVSDGDDAATRTATVVVKTSAAGVADLHAMVAALAGAGTLSKGEANSLDAKLDAAAKQLAAERPAGVQQLEAFVNEVEALERSGRLPAAEADGLVGFARRLIRSAGG